MANSAFDAPAHIIKNVLESECSFEQKMQTLTDMESVIVICSRIGCTNLKPVGEMTADDLVG